MVIGAIFSIAIFVTAENSSKGRLPKYAPYVSLVGFGVSCYWVYLTSNVLMDFL